MKRNPQIQIVIGRQDGSVPAQPHPDSLEYGKRLNRIEEIKEKRKEREILKEVWE